MAIKKKKAAGMDYFWLAMSAFGGLGLEVLYAFFLEPALYGSSMSEWNTPQIIGHWVLTCITWGIVMYLIIREARLKYDFDLMKCNDKISAKRWCLALGCVIFSLALSYHDWGGFKVIKEFQNKGLIRFIFQYLYYFVETGLFTLIIVFGQKAMEKWFHRENLPYGGIVVALTWGMAHMFTKGSLYAGLFTAFGGFLFGVTYLLLNRNFKWTYLVLFIMFAF